jgi:hypothetical protein
MFMKEGQISAANAGAVMSKLLQISLGWVYDDKHKTIHLDNHLRNSALVDLVEAAEHKVLIFVPFIHALQGIKKVLDDAEIECATVSGATPLRERDVIFREFQLGRTDDRPQLQATATEKHIYGLLTHHIKVQDSLLQLLEEDSRAMMKEAA